MSNKNQTTEATDQPKTKTVDDSDAVNHCRLMREELERLRDVVSAVDVEIIDAVLSLTPNIEKLRDAGESGVEKH